jgi:hypothetical protein
MRMNNFLAPLLLLLLLVTATLANSSSDRTTRPLNNSAEEQIRDSFRQLLSAYSDGDVVAFFENVSEDKFQQDYLGFDNAIREDFRMNSILNIDYVFNQTVPSGKNKYFLFVKWEKLYQNIKAAQPQTKRGTSRFLFQKIKGKYKLIGMSKKILFGDTRSNKEFKK